MVVSSRVNMLGQWLFPLLLLSFLRIRSAISLLFLTKAEWIQRIWRMTQDFEIISNLITRTTNNSSTKNNIIVIILLSQHELNCVTAATCKALNIWRSGEYLHSNILFNSCPIILLQVVLNTTLKPLTTCWGTKSSCQCNHLVSISKTDSATSTFSKQHPPTFWMQCTPCTTNIQLITTFQFFAHGLSNSTTNSKVTITN